LNSVVCLNFYQIGRWLYAASSCSVAVSSFAA
jgi:hypothetical protein